MKRGLVIGKFMPLHQGHVALIRFASQKCDELIVSMSYTPMDPIDPDVRFSWIQETFRGEAFLLEKVLDDFDDESLPLKERTQLWARFIKKRFPSIDVLFSSEEYGEPLAGHLGIEHVVFDMPRKGVPVSATKIREKPFRYWSFIPEAVRSYYVKKICFYGPESTGKSVMAKQMAEKYQTEFVPEVAREMISSNEFTVDDIIHIGQVQTARVIEKAKSANKFLFCDTDVITTQIYSEWYLHQVPAVLQELEREVAYEVYFLFDIDVPWVPDGLRDLGEKRNEMLNVFRNALERRSIPFVMVRGDWEERTRLIRQELERRYSLLC